MGAACDAACLPFVQAYVGVHQDSEGAFHEVVATLFAKVGEQLERTLPADVRRLAAVSLDGGSGLTPAMCAPLGAAIEMAMTGEAAVVTGNAFGVCEQATRRRRANAPADAVPLDTLVELLLRVPVRQAARAGEAHSRVNGHPLALSFAALPRTCFGVWCRAALARLVGDVRSHLARLVSEAVVVAAAAVVGLEAARVLTRDKAELRGTGKRAAAYDKLLAEVQRSGAAPQTLVALLLVERKRGAGNDDEEEEVVVDEADVEGASVRVQIDAALARAAAEAGDERTSGGLRAAGGAIAARAQLCGPA